MKKPRERGRRAHKGGLGGPAVAVKPRAPRKVSPAQSAKQMMSRMSGFKTRVIWRATAVATAVIHDHGRAVQTTTPAARDGDVVLSALRLNT